MSIARVFLGALKDCDLDASSTRSTRRWRRRRARALTADGFCPATLASPARDRAASPRPDRDGPGDGGRRRAASTRVACADDFRGRASSASTAIATANGADRDRRGSHRRPWAACREFELRAAEAAEGAPPVASQRPVYFDEASGWVATRIYRGVDLMPGAAVDGPAVIEEATTSVIVAPGDRCTVDSIGNFLIRFDEGARA